MKDTIELFTGGTTTLECQKYNHFTLDLEGAVEEDFAIYNNGVITAAQRLRRGTATLPKAGLYYVIVQILKVHSDLPFVFGQIIRAVMEKGLKRDPGDAMAYGLGFLESMIHAGWVKCKVDPNVQTLEFELPKLLAGIRMNDDTFVDAR